MESTKEALLKEVRGCCIYCGHPITLDNMTVDHIIPKSKGGVHRPSNLVACCKECNSAKADLPLGNFLLGMPLKKQRSYMNRLKSLVNCKRMEPDKGWFLEGHIPLPGCRPQASDIPDALSLISKAIYGEMILYDNLNLLYIFHEYSDPDPLINPVVTHLKELLYWITREKIKDEMRNQHGGYTPEDTL